MVVTPWRLDFRRPYIQLPPPESVSELLSLDQWVDFESEGEAGVDFRVPNTRRPVIRHPSVESMPELPVIDQRIDFDFEGEAGAEFRGPDLRLPLIQVPQPDQMPELPSLDQWADNDSEGETGAEPRAPNTRAPFFLRYPSIESMPELPSMDDYVPFDHGEETVAESRAISARAPISIRYPSNDSMPPSPAESQWPDDSDDNDPQGMTGIEFRAPDPVQSDWFRIGEAEPVYPLVSPVMHEPYHDGNILRFPWFNDIPDKRFFAMVGIAHYSSDVDRYTHISHWGANQGCPIKDGQQVTVTPNLESQRPWLSISVMRNNGTTVECRVYGSECVTFLADGPGEVGDWWFEAGSEQHAQRRSNKLLQFRWQLKTRATLFWNGITEDEINGMNSEWLIAHPNDAMIVELTSKLTMSATITLQDEDPKLFADYFQAMMVTAYIYGNR